MAYKNKEDADAYQKDYYYRVKKLKYKPHPRPKKTKEEKLELKRLWYKNNLVKVKESSKRSRLKHKEKRYAETRIWLEKNKDKQKQYHEEYHKKYYQDNKEETDKRNREWSLKNPEKRNAISKKYAENNPEKMKQFFKNYSLKFEGRFRAMKGSAKARNYPVEINLEEFTEIVSKPCVYCGEDNKRIGIDRIDNSKGYTLENSAPCCFICNMMKKTMGVNDFSNHVKKIHNHINNN
jgi:hypothetical protein